MVVSNTGGIDKTLLDRSLGDSVTCKFQAMKCPAMIRPKTPGNCVILLPTLYTHKGNVVTYRGHVQQYIG